MTITIPFPQPEPQPSQTAADLVATLQHTSHLLQRVLSHHFAEFGLTEIRYEVLQTITSQNECTQSILADRLNQSESSISTLIERMRKDGLLYRLASESDRRKRVLILSEKGQSLLAQIDACHNERMRRLLGDVTPEETANLVDQLRHLQTRLGHVSNGIETSLRFPWPAERIAA